MAGGLFGQQKPKYAPDRDGNAGVSEGGSFDVELQDFLAQHHDPEAEYVIRLFRVRRIAGLPEKNAYLQTWRGSVPEYDEIAAVYGPGKYRCNIIYMQADGKRRYSSRIFEIDPDWGGARGEQDSGRNRQPVDAYQGINANQQTTLEMFRIMAGLFSSGMKAQGSGNAPDLSALTKAMSGMVLESARSQFALVDELARARLPAGTHQDDSDDDTPFIVEAIQWLRGAWSKYGSAILGNPKAGAAMLKGQAASLQQVQYAITHPHEYKTLYDRFVAESNAPPEKLDEFIHSLGYPTPADLLAQEAAGADQTIDQDE